MVVSWIRRLPERTPAGIEQEETERTEILFIQSSFPLFAPVSFVSAVFISLLLEESGGPVFRDEVGPRTNFLADVIEEENLDGEPAGSLSRLREQSSFPFQVRVARPRQRNV